MEPAWRCVPVFFDCMPISAFRLSSTSHQEKPSFIVKISRHHPLSARLLLQQSGRDARTMRSSVSPHSHTSADVVGKMCDVARFAFFRRTTDCIFLFPFACSRSGSRRCLSVPGSPVCVCGGKSGSFLPVSAAPSGILPLQYMSMSATRSPDEHDESSAADAAVLVMSRCRVPIAPLAGQWIQSI